MPATKTLSPDGTITVAPEEIITVAVVRTPNEQFNGVRNRIKFHDGLARLPEPKVEDYNSDAAWLREHQVWDESLRQFRLSGYQVSMQKIALMGGEDPDLPLEMVK